MQLQGQTFGYQYSVKDMFDGATQAPSPPLSSAKSNGQQFYSAKVERAGIFPVNDSREDGSKFQGAQGTRWVTWVEIVLDSPAPPGSTLEVVDTTTQEGDIRVLKEVVNYSGAATVYVEAGFMVPQGAALRVSGGRGTIRYDVVTMLPSWVAILASLAISSSPGPGPSGSSLVFSLEIATDAGVVDLGAGVLQRYDPTGLDDDDMIFLLPPMPTKDQLLGIKEVGDSGVSVLLDGNGNDVETWASAPAAMNSTSVARQALLLQYDGAGTWRAV